MSDNGRLQALPPDRLARWCRVLLTLNGVLWTGIGIVTALGIGAELGFRTPVAAEAGGEGLSTTVLVALMLGNAVILLGLSYRLRGMGPSVLIAAPLWTAVNLVLSFTDDVGLPDLLVGLLNLVTLLMLLLLGLMWWRRRKEG